MRKIININENWLYSVHDLSSNQSYVPIHTIDFDESDWKIVNIPHDGSIGEEFAESNPSGPRGGYAHYVMCYYRKHFDGKQFDKNQEISVTFGGIYCNATVFFNGEELGTYPYGYTTVTYDLTKHFNFDGDNLIAVRVDNELQPSSRWYTGQGIYRDVVLTATEDIHVKAGEVFIKSHEVSEKFANVSLNIPVINGTDIKKTIYINCEILTDIGESVISSQKVVYACANEERIADFVLPIFEPKLWSADTPNRYTAKITLTCDNEKIDEITQVFGIRDAKFTPNGFYINGKKERLKGVCLHHDNGSLGACAYKEAFVRKLSIMKEMGVNAIRTSHNPEDVNFLDLCDEMGFYVMEEAFDEWTWGKRPRVFGNMNKRIPIFAYSKYFKDYADKDLSTMIIRDRNHPSIIAWSIGNEIEELREVEGEKYTQWLNEIVHKLDDTRPATIGGNGLLAINATKNPDIIDACGYNYAEDFYENDHKNKPERCMIGSETCTITAFEPRGEYIDFLQLPFLDDARIEENADPEEQAFKAQMRSTLRPRLDRAERSWGMHKIHDYVAGNFIWTGVDYLGETTPKTWPSISSYFAPVDRALFPKDAFYFYQSIWADKDVLHILPHWNLDVEKGTTVPVWAFTNCDEVELFVNGVSYGKRTFKDEFTFHMEWEVPYEAGEVHAVGIRNGKTVEQIVKTTGCASKLALASDRMENNQGDLAYLTVSVTDDNGVVVPTANYPVDIICDDGIEILGVDNGHPEDHTFQGNKITTWCGLARIIVKTNKSGTIKITNNEIEDASIQIKVK